MVGLCTSNFVFWIFIGVLRPGFLAKHPEIAFLEKVYSLIPTNLLELMKNLFSSSRTITFNIRKKQNFLYFPPIFVHFLQEILKNCSKNDDKKQKFMFFNNTFWGLAFNCVHKDPAESTHLEVYLLKTVLFSIEVQVNIEIDLPQVKRKSRNSWFPSSQATVYYGCHYQDFRNEDNLCKL